MVTFLKVAFWSLVTLSTCQNILLASGSLPIGNSRKPAIVHLCDDTKIDSAVSISSSQIVLFRNTSIWVLDLLNYQVNLAYSDFQMIDNCLDSTDHSGPLYAWNQHSDYLCVRNKICLERNGHLCQVTVSQCFQRETLLKNKYTHFPVNHSSKSKIRKWYIF